MLRDVWQRNRQSSSLLLYNIALVNDKSRMRPRHCQFNTKQQRSSHRCWQACLPAAAVEAVEWNISRDSPVTLIEHIAMWFLVLFMTFFFNSRTSSPRDYCVLFASGNNFFHYPSKILHKNMLNAIVKKKYFFFFQFTKIAAIFGLSFQIEA